MKKPSSAPSHHHPGFDKMVHKGGNHPGFKPAVDKAQQAPMPQPAPGGMPMQGTVSGPPPMGGGNEQEGC